MAEEGKLLPEKEIEKEKGEDKTEEKNSNPAPTAGDEEQEKVEVTEGKEEETEGNNLTPAPVEGEKKGGDELNEKNQENEEADSDSGTFLLLYPCKN
jgi:hypothetical protein